MRLTSVTSPGTWSRDSRSTIGSSDHVTPRQAKNKQESGGIPVINSAAVVYVLRTGSSDHREHAEVVQLHISTASTTCLQQGGRSYAKQWYWKGTFYLKTKRERMKLTTLRKKMRRKNNNSQNFWIWRKWTKFLLEDVYSTPGCLFVKVSIVVVVRFSVKLDRSVSLFVSAGYVWTCL